MTNVVAKCVLIPLLRSRRGRLLGRRLAVVEYAGRRSGTQHRLVTGYLSDAGVARLHLAGQDHEGWEHVARDAGEVRIVVDLAA